MAERVVYKRRKTLAKKKTAKTPCKSSSSTSSKDEEHDDDSSDSEDQIPISQLLQRKRTRQPGKRQVVSSSSEETQGQTKAPEQNVQADLHQPQADLRKEQVDAAQQLQRLIIEEEAKDAGVSVDEYLEMLKGQEKDFKEFQMKMVQSERKKRRIAVLEKQDLHHLIGPGTKHSYSQIDVGPFKGKLSVLLSFEGDERHVPIDVEKLVELGINDWISIGFHLMQIKPWTTELQIVYDELMTLMEHCQQRKIISTHTFNNFCVMMKFMPEKNRLGIILNDEVMGRNANRLPKGLEFIENEYIGDPFNGFCYYSSNGQKAFQRMNALSGRPYAFLVFLKWLCTSKKSRMFRKRITRILHFQASRLKELPEYLEVKQEIEDEFLMDEVLDKRRADQTGAGTSTS